MSTQAWQAAIGQVRSPSRGCFTADYPSLAWRALRCTSAPSYPQPPKHGTLSPHVGNGADVATQAPNGSITSVTGSFEDVEVTDEKGPIANAGPPVTNAYTLQLNTNYFATGSCAASPNPDCEGWQQFIFENNGHEGLLYIQYWLIRYNAPCPLGASWHTFSFTGDPDIYCWQNNGTGPTPVDNQPITNLANLSLTGEFQDGSDKLTLVTGPNKRYTVDGDNAVNAVAGWNVAEFNVFGDGGNADGGSMASFNDGARMTVRTHVNNAGAAPPICVVKGYTAESNNLGFGPKPAASSPGPAVLFKQDTKTGLRPSCSTATAIGEPHLTTFAGLAYDFQASGDFVAARVGADFEVQTRQASGAPVWPLLAVNKAVATRMGATTVALCGSTLMVNGHVAGLGPGGTLSLPTGVVVTLTGNSYIVRDQRRNSVRATAYSNYVDVTVDVGDWPAPVRGLLGNPDGDAGKLEARDGTRFSVPLSFTDLYQRFGNSWRVAPAESLLLPCGGGVAGANPARPFRVSDLAPSIRDAARATCVQAGVAAALLDACTLDVAVLGPDAAAAHVGARIPVLDGNGSPPSPACTATYRVISSQQSGFQAEVTVTAASAPISGWSARWTLAGGQSIVQLWNGTLSTSGSAVTVRNLAANGTLAPGASTTFGFIGAGPATVPASVACTSP